MPVGARNAIIILGLAALVVVWERAFTVAIATASQVISILFVVAMLAAGVAYFRRNQLAWLVLRPWQRVAIVLAALAIAFLLVAGPAAADVLAPLAGAALPARLLDHVAMQIAGIDATVARVDWAGAVGFLLRVSAADRDRLASALRAAGIPEAGAEAVEAVRIEEGRPAPADIVEKTLPQELGRDARAISFTKGCYLGQETVARIDALGHVNRRLVAVATAGPVEQGAIVTAGGETIGTVTSACLSPRIGGGLGLVLALTKKLAAGAAVEVAGAPARVVPLPVAG
jgi:folate-binding protein YgfZ